MSRYGLFGFVLLSLLFQPASAADPVFSGPQAGEKMPSFQAKGVFGDLAGKEFDLIKQANGKPVVLIFFHARTRPAFGLTNTIMKYAGTRSKDGLHSGVIFLTDDPTSTESWMQRVEKYFSKSVAHGISLDGQEGPGSYGLNRNVTLTVLVGKQGKVTANFALIQPSLQSDGPKILKAIVDATGGGKVPTIAELEGERYRGRAKKKQPARKKQRGREVDSKLGRMLRSLINKQATADEVEKASTEIEEYVAKNPKASKDLGRITNTIVRSGKLANYGTKPAQELLTKWAKKYAPPTTKQDGQRKSNQ